MTVSAQALSKMPLFAGLDEQALQRIVPYVHEMTVSPGQAIIWEGEPCQATYFIVHGLVRTRRMSPNGREQVLAYLGPGECVNLVAALDGKPSPVTADAVIPTVLYYISCADCRHILKEHGELAHTVLQYLAGEVRRLSDLVESLALYTVRTRLARFLLHYADEKSSPRQWTQEEIAAHIGTVREMVGRTLRDFAAEGLIRRQRGRIVITDRAGLEREASGAG
ncbi:MAG: Crp/Fnr family transcriptional regulator [Chloroflexi bacterium]|nr:Crp/Fnr family transcriptional regulator [Chloroflexota bacterium]